MIKNDTITAIATSHGTGGIGIIRISGENSFEIASRIFIGKRDFVNIKTHTINYGKIVDPHDNCIIDEVLLSKMIKPNTFTRDDIVEINCHGGMIVLRKILELILRQGARLAEPGEFTKRAFLNGRIDLSQAEAVIDIINSKTDKSSKAAIEQLEGKLSKNIKSIRQEFIGLLAHIEAVIDYPEHDIDDITGPEVYEKLKNIKERLLILIEGFDKGKIIRDGLNVVIIGKPNVGKSSLLNELTGKNRAIVTDTPGTTRDILEEYINIGGLPVLIFDTAGIRETKDEIEKIGVEKAEDIIKQADLVLMLIDSYRGIDEEDRGILKRIEDKKTIIILNKIDIANKEKTEKIIDEFENNKIISISAKEGFGIDALENEIKRLFELNEIDINSETIITNVRHKNLIECCINSVEDACIAFENNIPIDCMTIDIKNAADYLGQITGETVSEDVINEIFKRFCIGK